MNNYTEYLNRFDNYKWQLRALSAKETELRKIKSDINSGNVARDLYDPEWQQSLQAEIAQLKRELTETEQLIDLFPDTREYTPCKLFLRLHYIIGCNFTETATEMEVSQTTLRRIRDRCINFFENFDK